MGNKIVLISLGILSALLSVGGAFAKVEGCEYASIYLIVAAVLSSLFVLSLIFFIKKK